MTNLKKSLTAMLSAHFIIPCYRFGVRFWELFGLNRIKRKINRRDLRIMSKNFEKNQKSDCDPRSSTKNRLLNDQNGLTGRSFSYGDFSADYNACETIAMHNVRVMLGCESTLSETIRTVQARGGMFCRGKWGTKISHIGIIMAKEYGLPSKTIRKIQNIRQDGIYIISFWNTPKNIMNGLHTVALRLENGTFNVYNCSHKNCAIVLGSDEFRTRYSGGFVIAYYFGEVTLV